MRRRRRLQKSPPSRLIAQRLAMAVVAPAGFRLLPGVPPGTVLGPPEEAQPVSGARACPQHAGRRRSGPLEAGLGGAVILRSRYLVALSAFICATATLAVCVLRTWTHRDYEQQQEPQ